MLICSCTLRQCEKLKCLQLPETLLPEILYPTQPPSPQLLPPPLLTTNY